MLHFAGAAFLVGLLGGVHCAGMCGGLATALTRAGGNSWPAWKQQAGYSLGRLASYGMAGAMAGSAAGTALLVRDLLPVQLVFFVTANVMLIAMGLYLAGWSTAIARLEIPGRWLWNRLGPRLAAFIPADSWGKAFGAGLLWGWVPCGMVYSMLALAMLAGSTLEGAGVMLAFGLGTLPSVAGGGLLLRRLSLARRNPLARALAGLAVIGLGILGLLKSGALAAALGQGLACIV